jgi:hypothetical protein
MSTIGLVVTFLAGAMFGAGTFPHHQGAVPRVPLIICGACLAAVGTMAVLR